MENITLDKNKEILYANEGEKRISIFQIKARKAVSLIKKRNERRFAKAIDSFRNNF